MAPGSEGYNILDQRLKNINFKNIITLVLCTATSVGTVLGVYYGFKTDQAIMQLQIKLLERRVDNLENKKNSSNENSETIAYLYKAK